MVPYVQFKVVWKQGIPNFFAPLIFRKQNEPVGHILLPDKFRSTRFLL